MESIGQKFKEARKEQGLFIEQVAKDTNISKRYIEAIEEEKYDEIPGEVYLFGFLRSYAGYLGINADEIINLYKNIKIQEQPVPMKELLDPKPAVSTPMIIAAAVLLVLSAAAGGVYFFLTRNQPAAVTSAAAEVTAVTGEIYEMNRAFIERRFNEGDAIVVTHKDNRYRIILSKAGDSVAVTLPGGILHEIEEGAEKLFDLDNDATNDIKIIVRDIDAGNRSAVIRFDKTTEAPALVMADPAPGTEAQPAPLSPESPQPQTIDRTPGTVPAVPERRKAETVILRSQTKETFTVNMVFRGFCLVRYQADSMAVEERYFHRGETFILNVNNEAVFWVSNAGAVSATVNNTAYSFGGAGEVSVRMIKWEEEPAGRGYSIKALPLY